MCEKTGSDLGWMEGGDGVILLKLGQKNMLLS